MAAKKTTTGGHRRSTAHAQSVYAGKSVKSFLPDLSNYAELRRGLSPAMRAQTLSKTQLKQATPEAQAAYIEELNTWRRLSQRQKKERANPGAASVEQLFNQARASGYFTATEAAELATANLKLKSMSAEQARFEIAENLNVTDRTRTSDFYKAKYFLDHPEIQFDPMLATDGMLREIILSGYINNADAATRQAAIDEYLRRLGETSDNPAADYANEQASYKNDILTIARLITG